MIVDNLFYVKIRKGPFLNITTLISNLFKPFADQKNTRLRFCNMLGLPSVLC